jgi:hypothetical protein
MDIKTRVVRWEETVDGKPQSVVEFADGSDRRFLVRMMDKEGLKWAAINLSIEIFGVGQIFAEGQSETDCWRKAEVVINRYGRIPERS